MKPCSNNRKLIAWLAMDALDALEERRLRAHLETCEGCRRYLDEVSAVTEKLAVVEIRSDIQTSEAFHQKVAGALRAEETGSAWTSVLVQLQATLLSWRVALPVIGVAVVMIAGLSVFPRRPSVPLPAPTRSQAVLAPSVKKDFDPTMFNYQMVASRSLEKLDELLTRQGHRNPSSTPLYTASSLARANGLD